MDWKTVIPVLLVFAATAGGLYLIGGMGADNQKSGQNNKQGSGVTLTLYSGAGLRPAVSEITQAFEEKKGIGIQTDYAGSGQLLGRISANQRGDLFMPGAEMFADRAIERGIADSDTKTTVAHFIPVILVQNGNPEGITSLDDLTKEGVRLGIGDERACAIGEKTSQILEKNGIPYEQIKPQVVYKSNTVNELGVAIQTQNVDAVVMWRTNALNYTEHGDVVPIPLANNVVSTIPMVTLKSSEHPEEAQAFIDFATSQEGREIWRKHDYTISLENYKNKNKEGKQK